ALLDLSGPGGYVVLVGSAARHAVGLAGLMGGIHFIGINAPSDLDELPVLSLLVCRGMIPLRQTVARGVVVGSDRLGSDWLSEARRFTLSDGVSSPDSIVKSRSISTTFLGISNFARSRKPSITSRSIFAFTSASPMSSARDV